MMDVVQKRRNAAYRLSLHCSTVQVERNEQMNDMGNVYLLYVDRLENYLEVKSSTCS